VELLGRYSNHRPLPEDLQVLTNHQVTEPRPPHPSRTAPTRPRQRRFRDADLHDLAAAYDAGATVKELAATFGVHRNTVTLGLDRQGVTRRPRSLTLAQVERAVELYAEGWSVARIGDTLDVWGSTVLRALQKAGVRLRDPQGRER
jgi:transposase